MDSLTLIVEIHRSKFINEIRNRNVIVHYYFGDFSQLIQFYSVELLFVPCQNNWKIGIILCILVGFDGLILVHALVNLVDLFVIWLTFFLFYHMQEWEAMVRDGDSANMNFIVDYIRNYGAVFDYFVGEEMRKMARMEGNKLVITLPHPFRWSNLRVIIPSFMSYYDYWLDWLVVLSPIWLIDWFAELDVSNEFSLDCAITCVGSLIDLSDKKIGSKLVYHY